MAQFLPVDPFDLVIFGATGDLSRRKLLPALYHRYLDGQIADNCRIIGLTRQDIGGVSFQDFTKKACQEASDSSSWDEGVWGKFSQLLSYMPLANDALADEWARFKACLSADGRACVFYLATPPSAYVAICQALGEYGLNTAHARLVIEKPIGTDLNSAKTINEGVGAVFAENAIYRIDHYLGKESVQNLLALRFANALFEPMWSRTHIDHIQITVAESVGVEGRTQYYDKSGAVRDMIQNHLLQLVCLVAMEPPNTLDADSIRTEKIKVLQALRLFTPQNVVENSVRAQYQAGDNEGETIAGYVDTLPAQDKNSQTETFCALAVNIDNWRWAGVPFYLRTGKRMHAQRSEIIVQFKPAPHNLFVGNEEASNRLVLRLQPDEGVHLYMQIKEPGPGGMRLKSLPLNLSYAENFTVRYPDAYERLLMDVIRGNLSLFMRRDEVEAAWYWVDALLAAWDKSEHELAFYTAGTDGPCQANTLLQRTGRHWEIPMQGKCTAKKPL